MREYRPTSNLKMERKSIQVGEEGVVNISFSLDPMRAIIDNENGLLFEKISFDLTCVVCLESSGPPEVSCSAGHSICNSCYHPRMKWCPAEMEIRNGETTEVGKCNEATARVEGAIKKTAYYKLFMKETMYECVAKELGCDKVMSGEEIQEHQNLHCPYRAFRRCGYCWPDLIKEFHSIATLVQHVIEVHNIRVTGAQGLFRIRYDRNICLDRDSSWIEVGPRIRGILVRSENVYLLMGQDFPGKIRLWVSEIGPRREGVMDIATVCVVPAQTPSPETPPCPEQLKETTLPICSTVEVAVEMGVLRRSNLCLDLSTKFLRDAHISENGRIENCFHLMLHISTFKLRGADYQGAEEDLPEPDGGHYERVEEDGIVQEEIKAETERDDSDDSSDCEITEEELKKAEKIMSEPYLGTTDDEYEEHSIRRDEALEVIEKYNAQKEGFTVVKSVIDGFIMYGYVCKKPRYI